MVALRGLQFEHQRDWKIGATIRIAHTSLALILPAFTACSSETGVALEKIHCKIEAVSSVALGADSTITFDQPDMFNFAVDSRGEVYASPTRGGALMHWSAVGVLLPMVGSPGEGPGQLQGGNVLPFVVGGDTLYARDNHLHWVVFGPDHRFVRFAFLASC